MVESEVLQIEKNEYTHHILDGNKMEPAYTENHIHMQNITSWAYISL